MGLLSIYRAFPSFTTPATSSLISWFSPQSCKDRWFNLSNLRLIARVNPGPLIECSPCHQRPRWTSWASTFKAMWPNANHFLIPGSTWKRNAFCDTNKACILSSSEMMGSPKGVKTDSYGVKSLALYTHNPDLYTVQKWLYSVSVALKF